MLHTCKHIIYESCHWTYKSQRWIGKWILHLLCIRTHLYYSLKIINNVIDQAHAKRTEKGFAMSNMV